MQEKNYQRAFDRASVRTSVTIIVQKPELRMVKAWTDDLSPAGARVICEERLLDESVMIRVMLPELKEHYFRAEVVRSELAELSIRRGAMHGYGLKFVGICTPEEVKQATASLVAVAR